MIHERAPLSALRITNAARYLTNRHSWEQFNAFDASNAKAVIIILYYIIIYKPCILERKMLKYIICKVNLLRHINCLNMNINIYIEMYIDIVFFLDDS